MKWIKSQPVRSVVGSTALLLLFFFVCSSFSTANVVSEEGPMALLSQTQLPAGCGREEAVKVARNNPRVQACLANAPGAPYQLRANVTAIGPCPQGQGASWEILVFAEIPCLNPPFCPLAPTILVARIIIDCNCTVRDVECYV